MTYDERDQRFDAAWSASSEACRRILPRIATTTGLRLLQRFSMSRCLDIQQLHQSQVQFEAIPPAARQELYTL